MLKLATSGDYWSGKAFELNITFDTLRDYQWERFLNAFWSYSGMTGPFKERYTPGESEPSKIDVSIPEPTAAFSRFGAFEVEPGVRVGVEVLITRSLFECVTLLIPCTMFEGVELSYENPGLVRLEEVYFNMAKTLYTTTAYSLATVGWDQGCQIFIELISDDKARMELLKAGNFLARDDVLAALRLNPRKYEEVQPSLRRVPRADAKKDDA